MAVLLAYPFVDHALQAQTVYAVTDGMIYVLLALGLNIVVGYAGLLDLGYAAFFAIGAYAMGLLNSPVLGSPLYGHAVELLGRHLVLGSRSRRCSVSSSARRPCGSAATTSRSSRSASGRSSPSSSGTWGT